MIRASAMLIAIATLAACSDKGGDPMKQYGPNPVLPDPQQYLVPPMSVPHAVGWKPGEAPSVPAGLRIQAMATGLMHPRIVYPLPNGDILVVESNGPGTKPFRPKDYIQGKVKARAGAAAKGRQPDHPAARCRRRRRPGTEDGAARPAALALRRRLGRRRRSTSPTPTRSWLSHSRPGETKITAPGVKLADLPAGPINHHWTKAMLASPDGSKLYVGVGSNSNITENGLDVEDGRAAIWEVDRPTGAKRIYASGVRNPTSLAIRAGDRAALRHR